ncbi:MAG: hypothetical protein J6Q13_00115 [Clostridia bacterium]|nr:hypothetical protein [Clostridia bacterium]
MNYLISSFDCSLLCEDITQILKGAKYKVLDKGKNCGIIFSASNTIPFVFDLNLNTQNVLKVDFQGDYYHLLFSTQYNPYFSTHFKFNNREVIVNLSSELKITIEGECICDKVVENLNFSHFEIFGDVCLIYFSGQRNFVVVIKDKECGFANYYDECNISENEKYFMYKLKDSLNHGRVCEIKNNQVNSYLVYLDEEELNLKEDFISNVFLDCIMARNNIYCKHLLSDELEQVENINQFFSEFDNYFCIERNTFILTKKNTLSGIFKFVVENNKISNIIPLLH